MVNFENNDHRDTKRHLLPTFSLASLENEQRISLLLAAILIAIPKLLCYRQCQIVRENVCAAIVVEDKLEIRNVFWNFSNWRWWKKEERNETHWGWRSTGKTLLFTRICDWVQFWAIDTIVGCFVHDADSLLLTMLCGLDTHLVSQTVLKYLKIPFASLSDSMIESEVSATWRSYRTPFHDIGAVLQGRTLPYNDIPNCCPRKRPSRSWSERKSTFLQEQVLNGSGFYTFC